MTTPNPSENGPTHFNPTPPDQTPPSDAPNLTQAPPTRRRSVIIERKLGVRDLIGLFALIVSAFGLIYQHRALVTSEKELNAKIQDIGAITQRVEEETSKRLENERQMVMGQRNFIESSNKLLFISLTLRAQDTIFEQELNYAFSLALESILRLEEIPPAERSRVREDIVGVADMNKALAFIKFEQEGKLQAIFEQMKGLVESTHGKDLTLNELITVGGKLQEVLGPGLVKVAQEYSDAIKDPFARRTKYQGRLEKFMQEREDAYQEAKKGR